MIASSRVKRETRGQSLAETWLGALLLACFIAILPPAARAQAKLDSPVKDIDPVEGVRLGNELVARLIQQVPAGNRTNDGILKIEGAVGVVRSVPVQFVIATRGSNWFSSYETKPVAGGGTPVKVLITHTPGRPSIYEVSDPGNISRELANADTMVPFAGSDFWIADLGLEFLHWPGQRLVRKQLRRGQSCDVLESTNPKPALAGYRRVVSWLDIDSGAIVHADAYDAKDRLLKQFDPKEIRKVKGEWQLEEMEIRNRQKDTKTRIEFKLGE
jgi:hypothetical protein